MGFVFWATTVAEEARGHIHVWSQRNEKKLFIIIFASVYKLSAY